MLYIWIIHTTALIFEFRLRYNWSKRTTIRNILNVKHYPVCFSRLLWIVVSDSMILSSLKITLNVTTMYKTFSTEIYFLYVSTAKVFSSLLMNILCLKKLFFRKNILSNRHWERQQPFCICSHFASMFFYCLLFSWLVSFQFLNKLVSRTIHNVDSIYLLF